MAGAEDPRGPADVLEPELEEDRLRILEPTLDRLAQLPVVAVRGGDRLGEDRRVGGRAAHRAVAHEALELAGLQQLARERVEPDRDPRFVQSFKSLHARFSSPSTFKQRDL